MTTLTQPPGFPLQQDNLRAALKLYGFADIQAPSIQGAVPILEPGHIAVRTKGAKTRVRTVGWRWLILADDTAIATVEIPVGKNPTAQVRTRPTEINTTQDAANRMGGGILRNPNDRREVAITLTDESWNTVDGRTIAPIVNSMRQDE